MRVALMSGALKNAGDFLITKRSEELLKHCDPKIEIVTVLRNYALNEEQLNEVNKSDLILIGGGPCYVQKLSPDVLPFTQNLNDIVPRIGILGGGWYENGDDRLLIRNYKFSEQTIRFLHRVECDTRYLGCRDPYSVKVLANNGLWGGI